MRVALNSARYADGNLFVATVSGNLALTGNLTGSPLLSGDVLVEEANITVPENFGGGAQLIDVEHVRTPPAVEQTLARARIDERTARRCRRRGRRACCSTSMSTRPTRFSFAAAGSMPKWAARCG